MRDHKNHIVHVGGHVTYSISGMGGTISHIRHEDTSHVRDHTYI